MGPSSQSTWPPACGCDQAHSDHTQYARCCPANHGAGLLPSSRPLLEPYERLLLGGDPVLRLAGSDDPGLDIVLRHSGTGVVTVGARAAASTA